jgi:ABC-type dipeptide/oligopeptide/nickel transport system permease subunit
MQQQIISPGKLAWMRLKKNSTAMLGLVIISVSIILAIAGYLIIPDQTPYANTMSLPISLQKPGFSVDFLEIPRPGTDDSGDSFLSLLFKGEEAKVNLIPLESWKVKRDTFYYSEYGSPAIKESIPLASIDSHLIGKSEDELQQLIRKDYLSHRSFPLGTDRFGRDLFSRLIIGTRVSLSVGLIAVFISLVIGMAMGAIAGFFRGWADKIIMWIINVIWSVPTLLLVIAITMALGKGFTQVFIAVGLTMWVEVARIVRGQFFALREQQFVEAGRALGYTDSRLIIRHILPNSLGPVIVIAASNFASAILLEAGLSFLGMGAQPPIPSWGMMIKESYSYIVVDAAYLAVWPGIAIALLVLAFTLLGNGLRDAFDTKGISQ